jgi:CyaY protein
MTESEFLALAEAALSSIEAGFEQAAADADVDIECSRSGNVLEIEFDDGAKIIINSQTPMQEIWVASRVGGFHYRREGDRWCNTRDGSELFTSLSKIATDQAGVAMSLKQA